MGRHYEVDGKLYPSVTTVLSVIRKPFLERWRGDIGNEAADYIMHEAGDLGSEVHDIAEAINRGEPWAAATYETHLMAEAYEKWFTANVKEVVYVEHTIVNTVYGYAGRLDLCAVIRGDRLPSLLDIKTGGLYPDAFLQLAAYQKALPIKTKRRLIIHIDKKAPGKLAVKEAERDLETDYRMFLYCLELYRYFNRSKPKANQIVKIQGGEPNVSISA